MALCPGKAPTHLVGHNTETKHGCIPSPVWNNCKKQHTDDMSNYSTCCPLLVQRIAPWMLILSGREVTLHVHHLPRFPNQAPPHRHSNKSINTTIPTKNQTSMAEYQIIQVSKESTQPTNLNIDPILGVANVLSPHDTNECFMILIITLFIIVIGVPESLCTEYGSIQK